MGGQGTLEDVLYCPEVPQNLLSVRKMQQAQISIHFNLNGVEISKNGTKIITGKPTNNLIFIELIVDANKVNHKRVYTAVNNNYELWHQRLGHMGKSKFLELKDKRMVDDVKLINNIMPNDNICEACIFGNKHVYLFKRAKKIIISNDHCLSFIQMFVVGSLLRRLITKIILLCLLMNTRTIALHT